MTTKTFTKKDKKGREETWEWEETPELVKAIEQLQKSSEAVKDVGKIKKLHIGNSNFAPYKSRRKV